MDQLPIHLRRRCGIGHAADPHGRSNRAPRRRCPDRHSHHDVLPIARGRAVHLCRPERIHESAHQEPQQRGPGPRSRPRLADRRHRTKARDPITVPDRRAERIQQDADADLLRLGRGGSDVDIRRRVCGMEEHEGEEDRHGCGLDDLPRSLLSIYFNQIFAHFESEFDLSSDCPAFYLELKYPHSIVPAFLVHFGSLFRTQNPLDISILHIP